MYICIRLIIIAAANSFVAATAFFVGRLFLKHSLSFREACSRCCDLGISVVMEHSPVVAGSDADSDAAAPADRFPYFRASSHRAQGVTSDRILELREAFTRYDKDGTETIATKNLGSVVRWLFYDPTDAALQIMINKADPKGTGKIGLFTFILLMTGKLDDEGRPMKRQRTD